MSDEQNAPEDSFVRVNDDLFIPKSELTYRSTRAGGPGGQHVNTSSTRVELVWDVAGSPSLTELQRQRILSRLSNRVSRAGVLQLSDAGTRSQHRNRQAVTERLSELLAEALVVRKPRKKTRPTRAALERTRQAKKRRAEIKRLRGRVAPD